MGLGQPSWEPPKKRRINWRKRLRDERNAVIDEAIVEIKSKMRDVPAQWHRGYNSAVTTLELMRLGKEADT